MKWLHIHAILVIAVGLQCACAPKLIDVGQRMGEPSINQQALETTDGSSLPLRVWRPDGEADAVILALHGFNDYSNAFSIPGAYFADQKILVYAYDQRGFGTNENAGMWPGVNHLVRDMEEAIKAIRGAHPSLPFYVLGESMGGAVIMTSLSQETPKIEGVILVAPAVWGRLTMNPLYSFFLSLAAHTLPWIKLSGQGLGIQPSNNYEMLVALGKDQFVIKKTRIDSLYGIVNLMDAAFAAAPRIQIPALVLYGAKDEIIPKSATGKMLSRLTNSPRIIIYPDGYHMLLRDLGGSVVLADISAWIMNPDVILPSNLSTDWKSFFTE